MAKKTHWVEGYEIFTIMETVDWKLHNLLEQLKFWYIVYQYRAVNQFQIILLKLIWSYCLQIL